MFSLFKMERYRASKAKVIISTILFMAFISLFSTFSLTMGEETVGGINISNQFTEILSSQITLILWVIMISVYISAEYKNGFIKSIAGQVTNRGYLAVSKLLLSILYTVVMFIVSFIFVSVAAFIFSGDNVTLGLSSEAIILWCTQLILYVGFSCIFILIATLTRSSSLGIGFGIFTVCGLTNLLYTGISWVVNKIGVVSSFSLGSYMIETNVQLMKIGIPSEFISRAVLIGLVFIVVMTFASVQVLNKRDI